MNSFKALQILPDAKMSLWKETAALSRFSWEVLAVKSQDTPAMNFVLLGFCLVIAGLGIAALVFFLKRASLLKQSLAEVGGELSSAGDLRSFTEETANRLNSIFAKIPALSLCYQGFYQSLIPPQAPYELFYRSGRPAQDCFDREFILKNSLQLRFFNAFPSIIVAIGILGTVIGFAATVSHAQPLFESTDSKGMSIVVSAMFSSGAMAFWPAGIAILFAVVFQIVERVQTQQSADMIEIITVLVDTQMPPQTVEQITATSLTELRQQHQTILNFTTNYFTTLRTTVMKMISTDGTATVEELLKRTAETYIVPLGIQLADMRKNIVDSMTLLQTEVSQASRFLIENISAMNDEVVAIKNEMALVRHDLTSATVEISEALREGLSGFKDGILSELLKLNERLSHGIALLETSCKELIHTQQHFRTDAVVQLEHLRAEIKDHIFKLSNDITTNEQELLERIGHSVNDAATLLTRELEVVKAQMSNEFAGLDMHALHSNATRIADNSDLTIELLHQSKAGISGVAEQLVVSTDIMANDLHTHQNALIVEMNTQGQTLSRTVTAVGVDVAARMNAISHVLVGEDIELPAPDFGDAAASDREALDEKIERWNAPRENHDQTPRESIVSRIGRMREEIESSVHSSRDDLAREVTHVSERLARHVSKNSSDIASEIKVQNGEIKAQTNELKSQQSVLKAQGNELKAHSGEISKQGAEISSRMSEEMNEVVNQLARKINTIHDDLSTRVEQMTSDFNTRIARMDKTVGKDLDKIGDGIDGVARDFAGLTQDIEQMRDFLSEMPLSRIEVINNPLKMQSRPREETHKRAADKPAGKKTLARRKPREESRWDEEEEFDEADERKSTNSRHKGRDAS